MISPKVSIVVPIYNVEPYLEQCVDSIRNQTMREIEIILVDDGSPDCCPQMCDRFAEEDSRIRVIHQKNAGVSVARNCGMEMASAEWIMFVDPDDWLELNAVQILFETAATVDADIISASFYKEFSKGNIYVGPKDSGSKEYTTAQNLSALLGYAVGYWKQGNENTLAFPWGKLYKMQLLKENKLHFISGLKRRQDNVFNLYAVYHSKKIFLLSSAIYHYRVRNNSACLNFFSDQLEICRQVHSEMFAFMERYQLQQEFQSYYDYVILGSILEFSKLSGKNARGISDFRASTISLKKFCMEDECKRAIESMSLSSMPNKRKKLMLWLLKRHSYQLMILLGFIYGKLYK